MMSRLSLSLFLFEALRLTAAAADVDHFRTLFVFVSHVDALVAAALAIEADRVVVMHTALAFFETVRRSFSMFVPFLSPVLLVLLRHPAGSQVQ